MIIANMQVTTLNPWPPRLATFTVALLLAGSVVFWLLRWPARDAGPDLPVAVTTRALEPANPQAVARLLGAEAVASATPVMVDAASRFRLTGIIASGSGHGVALLSIDGKPPKPYRVGSVLEDGLMLQSVEQRSVALAADAKGPVRVRLELPKQ